MLPSRIHIYAINSLTIIILLIFTFFNISYCRLRLWNRAQFSNWSDDLQSSQLSYINMKSGMIKAMFEGFQSILSNQINTSDMNKRISRLMKKKMHEWENTRMENVRFSSFFSYQSKTDHSILHALHQLSAILRDEWI